MEPIPFKMRRVCSSRLALRHVVRQNALVTCLRVGIEARLRLVWNAWQRFHAVAASNPHAPRRARLLCGPLRPQEGSWTVSSLALLFLLSLLQTIMLSVKLNSCE